MRLTTCLSQQKAEGCSLKTLGLIISHQVILSGYEKIYLEKVK